MIKKMDKKQVLKKIELNKEKLKEEGVIKIGLFGSILKNKQNKKSDVDILVRFKDISFDRYITVLILLEKILKKKIDLITEGDLRPELRYVKKEAEYAKL